MVRRAPTQLEELTAAGQETAAVNKLLEIIISNLSIREGFQDFVAGLSKVVAVDWAGIILIRNREALLYTLSPRIDSTWKEDDVVSAASTDAAWLAAINKSLVKPGPGTGPPLQAGGYHHRESLSSIIYQPLYADDEAFGALIIASVHPDAYGEKETALLNRIGHQIAVPIWKSILFEKGTGLLTTICHLTTLVDADARLDTVLAPMTLETKKFIDFDRMYTTWIEGNKFTVQTILPAMETKPRSDSTYSLKGSAIGWVAKHKKTLIEPDLTRGKLFSMDYIEPREDLRSLIHAPLFSDDEVFAVITFSSTEPNTYGAREQKILEQIHPQIASTMKIIHMYALEREKRLKLETEEKERLQFINALAHELKTPVTAIVASAGLLLEELSVKPQSPLIRLTETIIRAIDKLEARLTELLDMARIGIMAFDLNLELLDIRPMLQNVLNELESTINENNQSVSVDPPASVPLVLADPQRLEQILTNLVTNAIKFSGDYGKVQIKMRREEDRLVVSVKDNGPGISREEQERIFQPYYRVEADRQRFPGLGLGLALSKQLVDKHGGSLGVESTPGKGSTFFFSLPIGEEGP